MQIACSMPGKQKKNPVLRRAFIGISKPLIACGQGGHGAQNRQIPD